MVIEAVIERATDGTLNVYCSKEIFSGAGDTIEEAKADMMADQVLQGDCDRGGIQVPRLS